MRRPFHLAEDAGPFAEAHFCGDVHAGAFVHNVFCAKRRRQDLFDTGQKRRPIERAVNRHGRVDAVTAQRCDQRLCLPMSKGDGHPATLAFWRPDEAARHVCRHGRFVDEHEFQRIEIKPSLEPSLALGRDGSVKPSQARRAPGSPPFNRPNAIPTWPLAGPGKNWQSVTRSAKARARPAKPAARRTRRENSRDGRSTRQSSWRRASEISKRSQARPKAGGLRLVS